MFTRRQFVQSAALAVGVPVLLPACSSDTSDKNYVAVKRCRSRYAGRSRRCSFDENIPLKWVVTRARLNSTAAKSLRKRCRTRTGSSPLRFRLKAKICNLRQGHLHRTIRREHTTDRVIALCGNDGF